MNEMSPLKSTSPGAVAANNFAYIPGFSNDFETYRDVCDATDDALDEEGPESIWSRPSWQFDHALQGG